MFPARVFAGAAVVALVFPLSGQAAGKPAPAPSLTDPPGVAGLEYRELGPAWGGRVSRAVGVPGDPAVYYAATASGGVWKSTDGGRSFVSIFDDQPISSIGSIAVAPSDPNVVYVGSGEANIRGNVAAGNGIYKSTDAGKTWKHVWRQEGQIGTMIVHPKNPDVAYAAVLGHAFGPNPERGVYRTRDGGATWTQVLKKDADTGASDIALDPNNPNLLFAGFWQARRSPWVMTSGGPGSGLYHSRDGGDTWTELSASGLPAKPWGKVGVAVAPSDSRRVYTLIEAEQGGLFRSDDGGETWARTTADRRIRQRAWYYTTLTVSPVDADEVWFPNVPLLRSKDGGKTLEFIEGPHHGDFHDVWIDPANPKRLITANDGGVDLSLDGGETWWAPPLPISQFYHVSIDSREPYHVAGAMQDIGTAQAPSNTGTTAGIRVVDWYSVGGGEAGWVVSHPKDPNIVYAGEYLGYLSRYDHSTGQTKVIGVYPENPSGWGVVDAKYRFQWTAPIAVSPHAPDVVYHGANVVFRSADRGETWQAISGDLTRDDESKQQWSGGPITGDNTGVEHYGTVFVITESPLQAGLIWAGSDDGLVHVTENGGGNWRNVTSGLGGLPEWGTVSMIEASRYDAKTAYVVVDAHRLDNMQPYLWVTRDLGKTWRRLDGGLPRDVYLHSVREDAVDPKTLYLGTERGVAVSFDGGEKWSSLRLNLPTVAVHDLAVRPDALVVGTNGRSLWVLDDLAMVRPLVTRAAQGNPAEPVALWMPAPAVRRLPRSAESERWAAKNPDAGAVLFYHLAEATKDEVVLDIVDANGRQIRRLSSAEVKPTGSTEYVDDELKFLRRHQLSQEAGLHKVVWDLRWNGAEMIPDSMLDSGYGGIGPLALPGTYTARLTAAGHTVTVPLELAPDPASKVSANDLASQLQFLLDMRNSLTRLTRLVQRERGLRAQLRDRIERLATNPQAAGWVAAAQALHDKLDAVDRKLHNPEAEVSYDILARHGAQLYSRLSPLYGWAMEGDGAVPQGIREVYAVQRAELDGHAREVERLIREELGPLNQQAQSTGVPTIYVPGPGEG